MNQVIESFIGRVESINGAKSRVTLCLERTDETRGTECATAILQQNGIGEGDEFRFDIILDEGAHSTRLTRLKPKEIDPSTMGKIRKMMMKIRRNF